MKRNERKKKVEDKHWIGLVVAFVVFGLLPTLASSSSSLNKRQQQNGGDRWDSLKPQLEHPQSLAVEEMDGEGIKDQMKENEREEVEIEGEGLRKGHERRRRRKEKDTNIVMAHSSPQSLSHAKAALDVERIRQLHHSRSSSSSSSDDTSSSCSASFSSSSSSSHLQQTRDEDELVDSLPEPRWDETDVCSSASKNCTGCVQAGWKQGSANRKCGWCADTGANVGCRSGNQTGPLAGVSQKRRGDKRKQNSGR
jgi:hypothetical protein